jgi:hypothetical protein
MCTYTRRIRISFLFFLSVFISVFISACAPVTTHYAFVDQRLALHDGIGADSAIEKEEGGYGRKSRLLYLLDRGMTLSLAGQSEKSNHLLNQAATMADTLYTESLTRSGASFLTNDNILPYAGEDFERVMIHLVSALNYAQQGEITEALVECRRLDTKLNSLNNQYADTKNAYQEDAFARYLSGILYESQGDSEGINNAFIAYRKSLAIYGFWAETYGTPIPEMIGADLLRTTEALHLLEEHTAYKKQFPKATWTKISNKKQGEIVIISFNGKSPKKESAYFDIVIDGNIANAILRTTLWNAQVGSGNIPFSTIGQLVRIAVPKYVSQKSNIDHLLVEAKGPVSLSSQSVLMADITAIAGRSLEDRNTRTRIRALTRATIKALTVKRAAEKAEEQIGGGAGFLLGKLAEVAAATSEVADQRSWRTLPDEIHLTRMVVPVGTYQVTNQFISKQGQTVDALPPQQVVVKAGEKKFLVVRTIH